MTIEPQDERFLSDVITTAIEGGIGYWSECSQYQYSEAGELTCPVGEALLNERTRATIVDMDTDRRHEVTPAVMLGGIKRILSDGLVRADLKATIGEAWDERDAGMIDAEAADVILQCGLFGDVRYG